MLLAISLLLVAAIETQLNLLLFAPKFSGRGVLDVLSRNDWFSLDYNLIWRIELIFWCEQQHFLWHECIFAELFDQYRKVRPH